MIGFYKTLKGTEQQISEINYEQLCKTRKDVFESIPDDKPIKMYFDADYVFYNGENEDFKTAVADEILKINKDYLTRAIVKTHGIKPKYAVAESHSNGRMKNGKNVWGYSFHIVIPNIVAFKKDMKVFTEILNSEILKDQKSADDPYSDYIEITEEFKPFDTSVYNAGKQKFRTVYSSKDGEDRPFNILEGTFQDLCITGFMNEKVNTFIPYTEIMEEKKTPEIVTENVKMEGDKINDMLFVKLALEKEMLISRSKDTDKWMATSLFLKGYFGDNNDSINLFHSFSKLYSAKFDERSNMEKWNGFVVNDKYDSFGIFVNWCKEENKDRCKEITNEIKQINKNNSDKLKQENNKKKDEDKQAKMKEKEMKISDKKDADELFKKLSIEFERTHTKIINKSLFVKKIDDSVIFMTKKDLLTSYEHVQCGINRNGNPESFIQKWTTCNNSINVKDDMENYPDVDNCPPNIFNLWTPFAMEKYTDTYETNTEALNFMLNHIRVLCGNDEIVYNYFVNWIAKMLQQPYKKLPCIVLISDEGAGKGTLMKLFSKMMGEKKVFETSSPSRDVWGHFNELMMDAFLVNLNELEFSETQSAEGKIKALITDTQMTINPKGTKAIKINSYHHFIVTTNKDNAVNSKKGDRRKLIARSSDELKGNSTYFNKMHKMLEDNIVIRTCYDYFKNHDISEFDETVMPTTEFQDDLKELAVTAPEQWLKDFTIEKRDEHMVELLGSEIYTRFIMWCDTNNMKFDTNPLKLGIKLKNLKIDGIEKGKHTNRGDTKILNIEKLKKHFNIGCLVEL